MAKLLLFNVQDSGKRAQLQVLALRLNITMIDVPASRQHCRIRDLLAGVPSPASSESEKNASPFADEMLVMNGFDRGDLNFFLNELRRTGHTVRLKAVVTETNQFWSAILLHDTLVEESLAMDKRS